MVMDISGLTALINSSTNNNISTQLCYNKRLYNTMNALDSKNGAERRNSDIIALYNATTRSVIFKFIGILIIVFIMNKLI